MGQTGQRALNDFIDQALSPSYDLAPYPYPTLPLSRKSAKERQLTDGREGEGEEPNHWIRRFFNDFRVYK
jgi:hypothetical protein